MSHLPLLRAFWIHGSFERDREPHGQYGIETENKTRLAGRNEESTRSERTVHMHLTREVWKVSHDVLSFNRDDVLTRTRVVGWYPGEVELMIQERAGTVCTSMRLKDS